MSVAVERAGVRKRGRHGRHTLADLAALPNQLPTGPVQWELWDGEIRLMSPAADLHPFLQFRITRLLAEFGEAKGYGYGAAGDAGVVTQPERPQTALGADVAFFTKDQLPLKRVKQGYLLTIPALVVEIRSKNDTQKELREKAERYRAAGARLVWVVDPVKQIVTLHRPMVQAQVLSGEDVLTADEIIPGLDYPVRLLFEGLV